MQSSQSANNLDSNRTSLPTIKTSSKVEMTNRDLSKIKSRPGDYYIPAKSKTNKNTLDYTENYGLSNDTSASLA